MRCAFLLSTALLAVAGAMTVTGSAAAQAAPATPGEARGLRYLSWSGRGPVAAPVEAAPARPAARADLRRPNPVIPHGGFSAASAAPPARPGLTPAPGSGRTLTPANAWLQPRPLAPEPAPPPPSPPAAIVTAVTPPPAPRTLPDYLPSGGRDQPLPAEAIRAPTVPAPAVDPMAPRRGAPIFRMESSVPMPSAAVVGSPAATETSAESQPRRLAQVAPTSERPPVSNARYYSVHRQNGRQPDALEMPAPTYVDAFAVTMVETPASQDLAEPEQGPTLIRDAQGRVRRAPAASDGDHQ